jgi:solute carrier family 6 (neurotransmitter transporter)
VFQCWLAAAVEVFLTWGLLGATAMQISSHNQHKHLLNRDTSLVIVVTVAVLLLTAFLANTCITILYSQGFVYVPSSFGKLCNITLLDTDCNRVQ